MVPIIEFSDMFCCEQLSPNESKQICVLQPYLEVRLYLGDMGLIFRNPMDCVCSISQGPASSVFEYGYLCASWAPECAAMGKCLDWPGKNKTNTTEQISIQYQRHVWEESWFTLPSLGPTSSQCGVEEEPNHYIGMRKQLCSAFSLNKRVCVCEMQDHLPVPRSPPTLFNSKSTLSNQTLWVCRPCPNMYFLSLFPLGDTSIELIPARDSFQSQEPSSSDRWLWFLRTGGCLICVSWEAGGHLGRVTDNHGFRSIPRL